MSSVVIAEKSHFLRHRTRRLTRREKWPIHVAFFLFYVFIHLVSSSSIPPPESSFAPLNEPFPKQLVTTTSAPKNGDHSETGKGKEDQKEEVTVPSRGQKKTENEIENTNGKEIKEEKENVQDKETEKESKKENGKEKGKEKGKESEKKENNNEKDNKDKGSGTKEEGKEETGKDVVEKEKENGSEDKSNPTEPSIISTTPLNGHNPIKKRKRFNCSAPAIEQFPQPLMGPNTRKHGGLILHLIVAIYTFVGLAIVCDDYFVSSLDRICEELRLSPDVAGATFMAAGSSAPELATVVIGVFFAQDDIGVSGVIGSAVFNIMFVISICGLCTSTASKLNWWPLCRDSFFYFISILVMLGTIANELISWPEAVLMLITYVIYCVVLSFNASLERWAKSLNLPFLPKDEEPAEQSALVTYKSLQEERVSYTAPAAPPPASAPVPIDPWKSPVESAMQAWDDPQDPYQQQQDPYHQHQDPYQQQDPYQHQDPYQQQQDPYQQQQQMQPQQQQPQQQQQQPPAPKQPQYYKAKEYDPNEISPLVKPTDGSKLKLCSWALVYPIHFTCRKSMPDVRQEKFRRWYPYTFMMSMIWISFYSYIMVWMITIIGSTLGIPDTVMGLTFVAAGVSVPDALSSLAVIKEGLGDMAVSNAVGSNVFDILVCLGLPWFIQTAIVKPGSYVVVTSRGLTYSTISLLSTVVFLVVATHLNGWKLDRRYGVWLMVWYLIFIVFASLYELNIFGEMNMPACPSLY